MVGLVFVCRVLLVCLIRLRVGLVLVSRCLLVLLRKICWLWCLKSV